MPDTIDLSLVPTDHRILLAVQKQVAGLVAEKAAQQQQIDGLVAERNLLREENAELRASYAVFEELAPPDIPRQQFAQMCFAAWERQAQAA